MKRKLLIRALMSLAVTLPLGAMAEEADCFPICAEAVRVEAKADAGVDTAAATKLDAIMIVSTQGADDHTADRCNSGFMKKAEALNDKVKPIRELVGYVRSPQGLAIKLANDHIVKIPAWVGYAMDPVGSLKSRAIDEVKTQVKGAMNDSSACVAAPADEISYPAIDIYRGHSI